MAEDIAIKSVSANDIRNGLATVNVDEFGNKQVLAPESEYPFSIDGYHVIMSGRLDELQYYTS